MVADHGRLADHDPSAVIDEEVRPDSCTWMDVDSGATVAGFGEHARQQGYVEFMEHMCYPLQRNRQHAWVRKYDLLHTAGRGVPPIRSSHVGLYHAAHSRQPGQSRRCKDWRVQYRIRILRESQAFFQLDGKVPVDSREQFIQVRRHLLARQTTLLEVTWKQQVDEPDSKTVDGVLGRQVDTIDVIDASVELVRSE